MSNTSMPLTLADAVVALLNAAVIASPSAFPAGLTWTATRDYAPIQDLSKLAITNPANAPLVYVFPGNDGEDIEGIGGSVDAEGQYEIGVLIMAYVGAPGPGLIAAMDPLLNLRQSIRTVLKTPGILGKLAGGMVPARTTVTRILPGTIYSLPTLLQQQAIESYQIFEFSVAPV